MENQQDSAVRVVLNCVKEAIRRPQTSVGGYPVVLVMRDGEILCPDCAKKNFRLVVQATRSDDRSSGWNCYGTQLHLEGPPEVCSHCGKEIESAYGDPDGEEQ